MIMKLAELSKAVGLAIQAQTATLNGMIGAKRLPEMSSLELFTLRSGLRAMIDRAQEILDKLDKLDK